MRKWLATFALVAAAGLGWNAAAADYQSLRHLKSTPPTELRPLTGSERPFKVQFARVVIHPKDGEVWALHARTNAYTHEAQADLIPWKSGALDGDTAAFGRVFDDELQKAGFATAGDRGLFEEGDGSSNLKVGVLIDEIQGRFCEMCPTFLAPSTPPGTVLMTARWEVYSAIDRRVVAKITTSGGLDYKAKLSGSFLPPVLESFRENVRQLIASDDFRRVVTAPVGAQPSATPTPASATSLTPIALVGPKAHGVLSQASRSVAVVYAADGSGSGFLVSRDGYVLTNQHVVGGSRFVKLKWSDGSEALGEVMRADRRRDVALIKTEAKGRAPLSLRLRPVDQGEGVYAIGTPLEDALQNTMTKGIVSAQRVEQGLRLIQSDVGINHGNSGGPLIDDKGEVVGIAVSGILPDSRQMGLNFFIPIEDALKALALTPGA